MEGTRYQVRVDYILFEAIIVKTGLKQDDTQSPQLFNLTLEKAVGMMQRVESGIAVNEHQVKILDFADDLNILRESLEGSLDLTMALETPEKKKDYKLM